MVLEYTNKLMEAQMLLRRICTDAYPEILTGPRGLEKSCLRAEEFLILFFYFFPFSLPAEERNQLSLLS